MARRDSLERALGRVGWRVRAQRAIERAGGLAVAGCGVAALGLVLGKLGIAPERGRQLVACGVALPLVGVALGVLQPVAPLLAARLLDAAHGLRGLCASAWAFRHVAPAARSAFMRACVERADAAASRVRAAPALPLRPPRTWRTTLALALCLGVFAAIEAPRTEATTPRPPPKARSLDPADLDALREEVRPRTHDLALDPDLARLVRELDALLEKLADREIDRIGALRDVAALEARLDAGRTEDEASKEALRALGGALGRDPRTDALREALAEPDARRAAEAMRELARALGAGKLGGAAREQTARALAHATRDPGTAQEKEHERQLERLERESKNESGQGTNGKSSEDEERLLQRQRKLDELRRQVERERQARRETEALRSDLGVSAGALGRGERDAASEAMERAAADLDQLAGRQRSADERERTQARLAQLRALLQEAECDAKAPGKSSGTPGHRLSLGKFAARARGDAGNTSGDAERGTLPGEGGEAGANLALPRATPSTNGQDGAMPQAAAAEGGREAGRGGRPLSTGSATGRDGSHLDTRVAGEHRAGPTRSEVIVDAARRGFASRAYRTVHQDYREHAERVLEHDRIPGGYRSYVRRYFELIRPREPAP